jgi:hypothetical protein
MGHPNAPDHDHHRGLWWGHHDVAGHNFWLEPAERPVMPRIRQTRWLHYQDGPDFAGLAVEIGWFDPQNVRILKQDLIIIVRPLPERELWLELQSWWSTDLDHVAFGKTNFGFVGLRVCPSMSVTYGDGQLTSSENQRGESAILGRAARWVDYSGSVTEDAAEGVTWFDQPTNPGHPTSWHVRADGWFSPSFHLREGTTLARGDKLRLLYGLYVHRGRLIPGVAEARFAAFATESPWELVAGQKPWRWNIRRPERAS